MNHISRMTRAFKAARFVYHKTGIKGSAGVGYDVTVSGRTRRNIGVIAGITASADRHQTKHTLGKLREICRAHDRQSSLFSGILNRALDNIFGANFGFIPNTGDKDLNARIKDHISGRMEREVCDATGVNNFADIAKTAIRGVWNDGDCVLVKRSDGSLLPFEADQVDATDTTGKKRIVLGVEMSDIGRHTAYHIKQRPRGGAVKSQRVPAGHGMMPAYRTRFGQTRGVPFLASILSIFDRTDGYLDNESFAAQLNATGGFKITKETTENQMPGVGANTDDSTNDDFDKVQEFLPGWVWEGRPGEDIEMVAPNRPGDNFEPYIITCCRIIGVGIGYPLELLLLDFSRTNYSSARASLNEARRMFKGWQKFSAENMCLPWYRWQISRAIAEGTLPANPDAYKVRCQWPAWEYIDPFKEAKGNEIAIKNRTKTISECIRERGGEPDDVFAEMADDQNKLKELGLTESKEKTNAEVP